MLAKRIIIIVLISIISCGSLFAREKEDSMYSVLVLDFDNRTKVKNLGWQIAELCRVIIPEFKRFDVIDRGLLKETLKKMDIKTGEATDSGIGIRAAKRLKSKYLIIGNIYNIGYLYSINIKLIDCSTGKVIKAAGLEFKDALKIRAISRALLSKILNYGRVSGKPVISEEEYEKRKKSPSKALYYCFGSVVIQSAALGGAMIISEENNPANVYTSLALAVPSVTPFYTEDWDYAPYIVVFSLASGVFNFIGYNLMEKVPEEKDERNSRDNVRYKTGISLFSLSIALKLTSFVLDVWRAHASVDAYNEKIRSKVFISGNIYPDSVDGSTRYRMAVGLRF